MPQVAGNQIVGSSPACEVPVSISTFQTAEAERAGCEFVVSGWLAGRRVDAVWAAGEVRGDPALLSVAEAVVASGATAHRDGSIVISSFDSLAGAIVALVRSLDHLDSAEIVLPTTGSGPR